ncbi:MAG: PilN domain-containing protein [Snowella sp.]|nr:PilN domain-containing protein [Snowella sp.]
MYSLDVNFLKDRNLDSNKGVLTTQKDAGSSLEKQLPIYIGAGVMALLPLLAGLAILLVYWQKDQTQQNIQALEAELSRLKAQNQKILEIEGKTKTIEDDIAGLAGVFDQIKPWSAILQDLTDQTPAGVQLGSIQQTGKQLNISGFAANYAALNDFMLMLQNSQFLKADKTKLITATASALPISGDGVTSETDDPTKDQGTSLIQVPRGVKYSIQTELSDTPDKELMPELIRKGAIGLITRFKTLEQKGILQSPSPPTPPNVTPAPGANPNPSASPILKSPTPTPANSPAKP